MSGSHQTLTASEFFERLQHDAFDAATSVTLFGMAKKSDGDEKAIQFAPGQDCGDWITIPLKAITSVEILRTVACRDHSHPLVKLSMKEPDSPDGRLFSSILAGMQPGSGQMSPTVGAARPGFGGVLPRSSLGRGYIPPYPSWPERGCRIHCEPTSCPNPSGHGFIWCTVCYTECDPGPPEFFYGAG
jgi:hypothetical protein